MELINWKAIAVGCIVFAAAFVIDSNIIAAAKSFFISNNIIFLEALIAGFAAAYTTGPNYKNGILNGALSILIINILFLTYGFINIATFAPGTFTDHIFTFIGYTIEGMSTIVPMIISGIVGAFLGTYFKKMIINAKIDKRGFLACDKCGMYYELQSDASPEVFTDKCECGGALNHVQDLNNADELISANEIKSKFRFHPVISIIFGLIAFFISFEISALGFGANTIGVVLTFVSLIIGGFVSTHFAKEKKMQYGLYLGLLIAVLFSILEYSRGPDHLIFILNSFIKMPLFTGIGGFIGAAVDNHLRNTGKEII